MREVCKRLSFTIFIVAIFFLGSIAPLPGVTYLSTGSNRIQELFNLVSGGTLSKFGFLALGISPYVTSSIIIQMLSKDIVKPLARLREQGQAGQVKINQIIRICTLIIAAVSASSLVFSAKLASTFGASINVSMFEKVLLVCIMTFGAVTVTYLGEQINKYGIGQGLSVLVSFGVLSQITKSIKIIVQANNHSVAYKQTLGIILVSVLAMCILAVYGNSKEFKYHIQNSKNDKYIRAHYLPIKPLMSSMVPVIFVSSLYAVMNVLNLHFAWNLQWTNLNTRQGFIVYVLIIMVFTALYNLVQIDGDDISKNLNKNSSYIINVPVNETSTFVDKNVLKISIIGGIFLALLATLSIISNFISPLKLNLGLSGISLLIVIGTVSEIIHQARGLVSKAKYKPIIEEN